MTDPEINASCVDVREFGAVRDGVTDNTAAIQAAIDAAEERNKTVYLPGGVWRCGNLVLRPRTRIKGEGPVHSTFKALPGVTGDFVGCGGVEANDLVLEGLSFDGGWSPGQPTGANTLHVFSSRPRVKNITIVNSAGVGLITTYVPSDRKYSILGHFADITIDRTAKDGWLNAGPNDSYFAHVEIVDASLSADATYDGYRSFGNGTVRGFDLHVWNRSPTGNKPRAGAYLANGGNIITGSHFESGVHSMVVAGGLNILTSNAWYAPDGLASLVVLGTSNIIQGMVGGGHDFFFPTFIGLCLGVPGAPAEGNHITLIDGGCTAGAIDFSHSGGKNIVRVTGYKAPGDISYVGAPQNSDDVLLMTSGPGGGVLQKPAFS